MADEQQATIYVEDETLRAGFTTIPNIILKRRDISPGAKLCYVMLLTYAWQEDKCFPGQERLADDMGVSDRSVRTYLKELEAVQLVVIKQRGLGLTNVYVLPRHRPENISGLDRKQASGHERKQFPPKKDSVKKASSFKKEKKTQPTEEERLAQLIQSAREVGTDFDHFFDTPDTPVEK